MAFSQDTIGNRKYGNIAKAKKMKQHSYKKKLLELIQPKKDLWEKPFDDVRVMLLTIGFPGSGSSLVGYCLTAHPSVVMADQPFVYEKKDPLAEYINNINGIELEKKDCLYSADLDKIFNVVLGLDYVRWLGKKKENRFTKGVRQNRYILVPNQYQGHFKALKVLGIKRSGSNVKGLLNESIFTTFKKRLEERGICLKFILTVRNPYDMVGSRASKLDKIKDSPQKPITTDAISFVEKWSEENMKFLKLIDPQDIFVSRHEEMVVDPRLQLTKLCEFVQVSASPDYLDSCASCVHEKPNRRRFEFEWIPKQKQEVASLIEQYDFFSGYDWES